MTRKLFFITFFICMVFASCSDDSNDYVMSGDTGNKNKNLTTEYPQASRLEFPRLKGGRSVVITHSTTENGRNQVNYSLEWDIDRRAQRWSCYQMYQGNTGGSAGRYQEGYPYDEQLPHTSYFNVNGEPFDPFWRSGFDHGHIVASADRQYSREANRQTFFLTNMQPQRNVFNSGIWMVMEGQVRSWNRSGFRDTLYVCKGGTIDSPENIRQTLSNGLIVPRYFFMALLCKNREGYKALGFWVEHLDADHTNDPLSMYVVNIRELEQLTGIDFFCNLPDEVEEHVEALPIENVKSAWGMK